MRLLLQELAPDHPFSGKPCSSCQEFHIFIYIRRWIGRCYDPDSGCALYIENVNAVSLESFVKSAIKVFGKGDFKTIPFPAERQSIEVGDYVADRSKIKSKLGWEPEVSLESGLKKTFDYYLKYKKYYWE